MNEKINGLKQEVEQKLKNVSTMKELNEVKTFYLGKKGPISALSSMMKDLSVEEKREFGSALNKLKQEVNLMMEEVRIRLEEEELNRRLEKEKIDVTLPSTGVHFGSVHPLTQIIDEIEELFVSM